MSTLRNDVLAQIATRHKAGELETCIATVVQAIQGMPLSPFHCVIDLDFENAPVDIAAIFQSFIEKNELQAIYTETNGFEINPDSWFFDLFGFEQCGDLGDDSWLGDFECDMPGGELFGMETLQNVYAAEYENKAFTDARELSGLLVVLKFQRLIQKALQLIPDRAIPVIVDAHDFGMGVVFGTALKKNKKKARPSVSVLGAKPVEMKVSPPGRQKEVYAWAPVLSKDGMPIGGQDPETYVENSIFSFGQPIEKAFATWAEYPGNKKALLGIKNPDYPKFVEEAARTSHWIANKAKLKYRTPIPKTVIEKKDVLYLDSTIPFVSEKVVAIFRRLCPNDFESFPIELMTSTGFSNKFFLINVTNLLDGCIDYDQSQFRPMFGKKEREFRSILSMSRLILTPGCMRGKGLARLYEKPNLVMVSPKIIDAMKQERVVGMEYVYLEDETNRMFKSNYLPNGQLI
jgi:hypothetical protein